MCVAFLFLALFWPLFSVSAADLNTLQSVRHGGVTIVHGNSITRSDLVNTTRFWTFKFTWPNAVVNSKSFLGVFRGTFGDIEGGSEVEGVNYGATTQSWAAGPNSIAKSIGIPALGELNTTSGTYTVLIAEMPGDFAHADTAEWFASGGAGGVEPVNYATLTFFYDGTFAPDDLDSIAFVEYFDETTPVPIFDGDVVLQKDLPTGNIFWRFNFDWPHAVQNQRALFVIFRGTFGDLEGEVPIDSENYTAQFQSWSDGNPKQVLKQMPLPSSEETGITDATYTFMIAERDPKYLDAGQGFSRDDQMEWFASGGTEGIPPLAYAFLEFDYRQFADCCSSVAFLAGIKAGELHEGDTRRWLPHILGNDARRLEMTPDGSSVNEIEVGNPIESVGFSLAGVRIGLVDIYEDFFEFLDGMVGNETIEEWQSLPYDWRFDVFDVVSNDVEFQDGPTINLIEEVRELAAQSDTGKVTLIGHSNGGLVGKALISALGNDAADVVDKFIMVGTPQLGTPSAIGAMLHGYGQSIPLLVDEETSRSVSLNMPGAYGLLPLDGYFDAVLTPVAEFDPETDLTADFRAAYGESIDSATELQSFLLGTDDGRPQPSEDDLSNPLKLSNALLDETIARRNLLESWTAPEGIEVSQIVGWGLDTISGIKYEEKCGLFSGCNLDIRPILTVEGDRTVVSASADSLEVPKYFLNLNDFNNQFGERDHKNLMGAESVLELLGNLVTNSTSSPEFITETYPDPLGLGKSLRVSVHSPVSISANDSIGRFTGIVENSDPTSDVPVILEEIPNSYYFEFGEGKYIGFGTDQVHELLIEGLDDGSFTLELEEVGGSTITQSVSYSNVPVTSDAKAVLAVQDLLTIGDLQLDFDGDGTIDQFISPDNEYSTVEEILQAFREYVQSAGIRQEFKMRLIVSSHVMEGHFEKNEIEALEAVLLGTEKFIQQKSGSGIYESDSDVLIEMLQDIRIAL